MRVADSTGETQESAPVSGVRVEQLDEEEEKEKAEAEAEAEAEVVTVEEAVEETLDDEDDDVAKEVGDGRRGGLGDVGDGKGVS